jgi:MFS family permease
MLSSRRIHFINFNRKLVVSSIFFLIPLHFLKIGLSGWQIGIIVSCFAFAPLIFSFPTGWINDRFSIKKVILGALGALALLFVLVAGINEFLALAVLFLCVGVFNNALDVSTNSLYFKDEQEVDLNKKYGVYIFWLGLGPAVGILLGGFLMKFTNFRILLLCFAAILAAAAFSVRSFNHEKFAVVPVKEYRRNIFRKKTMLFAVMLFVIALHWGVEGTVYSPFIRSHFQLNDIQLTLFIAVPLLILAFTALLIGSVRYDPELNKKIFLVSMFLSGAGLILMVQRNVYLSLVFRIIHEIGDGGLGALATLYISKLFERKSIGGSWGILLAIQTMGHITGALLFSSLGYSLGLQYPFYIGGGMLVANVVYGYFVLRQAEY